MKDFDMECENRKGSHIDGVGKEIRSRKIYAQQHRKRESVSDTVSTRTDCHCTGC